MFTQRPRLCTQLLIAITTTVAVLASTMSPVAAANPVAEPIIDRGVVVELRPYAQLPDGGIGRARINNFATAGDRLFVLTDFDGKIYELTRNGQRATPTLFLDVKAAIAEATPRRLDNNSILHGGLRGVAFHPDFESNGLFYTTLMESRSADLGPELYLSNVANPIIADGVLVEWRANPTTGVVDPNSYRQVFRVGMPIYDHPIKQMTFNPYAVPGDADYGMLYIGHGDGSTQAAGLGGGLNNDALGKVLRIDPTRQPSGARYDIPADNPFVGDPNMLDEVYSVGHRNPHHLSFALDPSGTPRLVVAEVGRGNIEEINIIEPGANYGWSRREGTFVHIGGGLVNGVTALPANDADNDFTYPAAQFGHDGVIGDTFTGQGIAGGHVIDNGSELDGEYFYSDFVFSGDFYSSSFTEMLGAVTELAPGQSPAALTQARTSEVTIRFDHDSNPATPTRESLDLRDVFNDSPRYDGSGRADVRFGQGPDGELYVSSKRNGTIYLVTNSVPPQMLCDGRFATVDGLTGTDGPDVIIGTPGPDVINGGAGSDIICARGGADEIDAGSGADYINAGWGSDVIRGQNGNDTIFGGPGLDDIEGGNGHDLIRGGRGGDRIVGNGGDDELHGGDGQDRLLGFGGDDSLFGGMGNDNLRGGADENSAIGGLGTDTCVDVAVSQGCE